MSPMDTPELMPAARNRRSLDTRGLMTVYVTLVTGCVHVQRTLPTAAAFL